MKVEILTPNEKTKKAFEEIDEILSKGNFTMGECLNILASLLIEGMAFYLALRPNKEKEKAILDMLAEMPKTLKRVLKERKKMNEKD